MKNPLHIAFAAASFLVLGATCLSAQAQQAEYMQPAQMQMQNQMQGQMQGQMPYQGQPQFQQAYPVMDQNQYAAQQWAMQQAWVQKQGQYQGQQQPQQAQQEEPRKAAKSHEPSDYELQEQAIQKGLSENASAPKQQSFNEGTNTNWSTSNNESYPGSPSKLRGLAKGATKMLGRTAQVALPTVGAVLLTRALNKNSMGMNRGYGNGYGYNNGYGTGYGNGYGTGYGNMGYNGNMAAANPFFGR